MSITQGTAVDLMLDELWTLGGTDLLLTAGAPPLVRLHGDLRPVDGHPPLSAEDTAAMVESLLTERQRDTFADGHELDFSFSWCGEARIRGNAYRQQGTVAVALRMVPRKIPSFDELGLPPAVRRFGELRQGLVFVTGPTGSGKSTTLASIVDWVNANRAVHSVTGTAPTRRATAAGSSAATSGSGCRDLRSALSRSSSSLRAG